MKTIGIAKLKAHLSHYLDQVKHGEEVLVTERGLPVAKIVPRRGAERTDSRRERLARAGVLQLGTGRIRGSLLKLPKGRANVGAGVLRALLAEREKGR